MRDKEARLKIEKLSGYVYGLREAHKDYKPFYVRECPGCKHETPQVKGDGCWEIDWNTYNIACQSFTRKEYDYLCLVCGSKLECITKTECKVIKEEKGGK